jgi:hypothetical protein
VAAVPRQAVRGFFGGVKAGTERHKTSRRELRQYPVELIDLTNDLLKAANEQLRASGRRHGLLLLFDNLDRFDLGAVRRLLFEGCSLLQPLACNAIFTMPIELHYVPETATYRDAYGGHATILPMLALRGPDTPWKGTIEESRYDDRAVREVLAALKQRIDIEALFTKPGDARLLVKLSGGCIRELLHLVNLAYQKSFTKLGVPIKRITSVGVRRAIDHYRGDLTEGLLPEDFVRLAGIARREPESKALDDAMLRLLRRRIAFRYSNGRDRWVDVHPLVIGTEGFQHAFKSGSRLVEE